MKSMATFALVLLLCVPARAQLGGMGGVGGVPLMQAKSIEVELLEIEQEADKAALKEALLLQAKQGMKPMRGTDPEKRQFAEETAALRDFIAEKKTVITRRADELNKFRVMGPSAAASVNRGEKRGNGEQQVKVDQQASYEKYAEAQVNAQLLETQVNLLQEPLNSAIQALANAEIAASNDGSKAATVEAARKEFEKIKAKYVGYQKQLQEERLGMRLMGGMGGMGGGMGGGFR
jgi:hypothetical protein